MLQRYVSKELTHFVGRNLPCEEKRYRLLLKILKEGKLIAPNPPFGIRGSSEKVSRNLVVNAAVPFSEGAYHPQVVCFCDIPVGDLGIHMGKYGNFGLSFEKSFLLKNGANPVFYIATESTFFTETNFDDMIERFRSSFGKQMRSSADHKESLEIERFIDFQVFSFMKEFGKATEDDSEKNYYMEREWRVWGDVNFELSDVFRIILPKSYVGRLKKEPVSYTHLRAHET